MNFCMTCKFFLAQENDQGLCRRYPPSVFLQFDKSTVSIFPTMLKAGYCGEYQGVEK